MAPSDKCSYPRCRSRDIWITHLGKPLCQKHWEEICDTLEVKVVSVVENAITKLTSSPPNGGWF